MEEFALYLFRSAMWITGFTFVWVVFLRNENFFHLKRIYLITGILASFIFPLITIRYSVAIPLEGLTPVYSVNPELNEATLPEPGKKISLLPVYLAGSILLTFRLIWHACRLFKKILAAAPDERAEKVIRSSNHSSPFSFFGYIFVNPEVPAGCMEEIMNHEKVHIRQKHWIDLLLSEFLSILQWFNPIVWVYKSYIRQNHEYLADREALRVSADPVLYRQTLFNQLLGSPVFALTNPFTESISKKRFDMMKKTAIHPLRKLRLLPLLPVIALIFWFCSEPVYHLSDALQTEESMPAADLSAENRPLVFVDDVETPYSEMDKINPNEIEHISVLKNNVVEIYGERAANGVILITLKKEQSDGGESEQLDGQQGTMRVRGLVHGNDGPIAGTEVVVSGSSIGTVTDREGYFELNAPAGSSLNFSARGFMTNTRSLGHSFLERHDPYNRVIGIRLNRINQPPIMSGAWGPSTQEPPKTLFHIDGLNVTDIDEFGLDPEKIESARILQPGGFRSINLPEGESAIAILKEQARHGWVHITTKK